MINQNEELCLTYEKAFRLKEDFLYLMQNPHPDKEGKRYDWFEVIVAPSEADLQKDFLDRYIFDVPDSFDYNLLKQYKTRGYTVVARFGFREGPVEFTRPLLEIIREEKLPFDKMKYAG